MKIAIVYNRESKKVINVLGMQNREKYGKKAIDRITNALKGSSHQVAAFEGDKDLIDNLENFMPRVLKGERPGMVFNLAYGVQGQARYTHVPGILEMIGLPYVGSGPMAHSLALDKVVAKMMFLQHGLPTPAFAVLDSPGFPMPDVPFPLIVKPRNEAMSFGLKIVNSETELRDAAAVIFEQFQQPVLVEQYIDGREINVGILGNNPGEALPPAELKFGTGPKIYTIEDKKRQSGREIQVQCPAELEPELTARAQEVALGAFRALGCLDCARVDLRLDDEGNFFILEINSLPSLGEHGSYVQGAEAIGLDFPGLINRLVDIASARYFGTPNLPEQGEQESTPAGKIFAFVTERRDRVESLLREWTQLSSRTLDPMGIRAATAKLDQRLQRFGLQPVAELTDAPEVATWQTPAGLDGGTLLVGHLDIPLPVEAATPAFRRDPEWLYGEGIGSSRAPLVMLDTALAALRHTRRLKTAKLGVLYYTDEGQDAENSKEVLAAAARRAKRVLVLRPGSSDDRIIHERRGMRRYLLHIQGEPRRLGQAGRKPDVMSWLTHHLELLTALSNRKNRIAVGIGQLQVQSLPMLMPHEVSATLLVGFPNDATADAIEQQIRDLLGPAKGGLRWRLERTAHRPALADRPANRSLLAELSAIGATWDIQLDRESSLLPSVAGLVPDGTAVVCGIGPATNHAFTTQEAVQRISLVQRTLLLATYLEQVSQR